jgi:thiol reductant ABC exporter CydC subunit
MVSTAAATGVPRRPITHRQSSSRTPSAEVIGSQPLLWLIRAAAGIRTRLLAAVAWGALASGCGVALMATSAWLISRAAQHPPVLYLMVAVVAVRTFGIGRGVLRYAERIVSHDVAFRQLSLLRERLIARLAAVAPAGLQLWRRGDLLTRVVSDVDDVGDAFLRGILPLGVAIIVGSGTVALAAAILPAAGIALAIALLIACGVAPALSAKRSAQTEKSIVSLRGHRGELIGSILNDLTDLTLGDLLPARLAELADVETRMRRSSARSARTAGVAVALAVLAMGAAVLAAVSWGVPAVTGGRLSPVLLAVIVLTPLALTDTVQSVGVAATALRRSFAAAERLVTVLATPPLAAPPVNPKSLPPNASGPVVTLTGVSARWPGSAHEAISDIDLELAPGRRIVVLGESGSGKSTLLAVLLGFLPPSAGQITIDGTDLTELDPDEARSLFSWCDQQAHLFDSTLEENIRLAQPDADAEQIAGVLTSAGAGRWLATLPQGLATAVGEHGQAVSAGQRQRIALARAILADRPVLLADEPSAHLDRPTADAITELILEPTARRCTVLVTHREADAAGADLTVRLQHGRITARW